jgi:excisionase family DNA binding protein
VTEKEDFISFEKALRDLNLRSEELRKLVSEGEIRAFRDGPDSMKFRREDVEALTTKRKGEEELSFADSLEDDTGMVTEQLSAEDTLLAEVEEEEAPKARRSSTRQPARAAAAALPAGREPGWVTAIAIVGFAVMLWGGWITYSCAKESDPASNFLTSAFSPAKKAPQ